MKKIYKIFTFAFIIIFLSGCAEKQKFDFTYIAESEPETLDPGYITGILEARIAYALFEGLVTYDPKTLEIKPAIAYKYQISKNAKRYTFYLRKTFWSDNTILTADDFVYSYKRILSKNNACPYAFLFFYIKNAEKFYNNEISDFGKVGIKALNKYTLQIELENPVPYFLNLLGFVSFFPVNKRIIEKYGTAWTKPDNIVSNGAFILKKRFINQYIQLKKNPLYYDKTNVYLNNILIKIVEDKTTAFNIYETNGADLITSIPIYLIKILKDREDFKSFPILGTYFYRINVSKYPLNNKLVRKALNLSIDKRLIVEKILFNRVKTAYNYIPEGIPGYTPVVGEKYKPSKAREYLDKAGFKDRKKFPVLTILYNTSENHKHIAEVIQQMWQKNLGIKVKLLNQEWKVYLNTTKNLDYEIARSSWIGDYLDVSTFLDIFQSFNENNRTGWKNKEYDKTVDKARYITDLKEREKLYQKAEKILLDDSVIIPIYFYTSNIMHKTYVKNIYPNIMDLIFLKYIKIEK